MPGTGLSITGHEDDRQASRRDEKEELCLLLRPEPGAGRVRRWSNFFLLRDNLWEGFTVQVTFKKKKKSNLNTQALSFKLCFALSIPCIPNSYRFQSF